MTQMVLIFTSKLVFLAQFSQDFLNHLIAASSTQTQSNNKDCLTDETDKAQAALAFANLASSFLGTNLNDCFNNENLFKGKIY